MKESPIRNLNKKHFKCNMCSGMMYQWAVCLYINACVLCIFAYIYTYSGSKSMIWPNPHDLECDRCDRTDMRGYMCMSVYVLVYIMCYIWQEQTVARRNPPMGRTKCYKSPSSEISGNLPVNECDYGTYEVCRHMGIAKYYIQSESPIKVQVCNIQPLNVNRVDEYVATIDDIYQSLKCKIYGYSAVGAHPYDNNCLTSSETRPCATLLSSRYGNMSFLDRPLSYGVATEAGMPMIKHSTCALTCVVLCVFQICPSPLCCAVPMTTSFTGAMYTTGWYNYVSGRLTTPHRLMCGAQQNIITHLCKAARCRWRHLSVGVIVRPRTVCAVYPCETVIQDRCSEHNDDRISIVLCNITVNNFVYDEEIACVEYVLLDTTKD